MTSWVDVTARARGLATHPAGEASARDDLAILVRWAADRAPLLAVILADEDRHALRALLRGLAAGVAPERRRSAATPTPRLSAATLRELADQPSGARFAAVLARRGHPFATALAPVLTAAPIDLLAVELAMTRAFARRARGVRDRALAVHASQVIDGENAAAALLLAARGRDLDPARFFVDGGARLSRTAFLAAARGGALRSFVGTPVSASPDRLESELLAWHLATQRHLARLDPTGVAPVLLLVLERRRDVRRLRREAWRTMLGGVA